MNKYLYLFLIVIFFILLQKNSFTLDLFYSVGPSASYIISDDYGKMMSTSMDVSFISDSEGRGGFLKTKWSVPAVPWFTMGFRYFHSEDKVDRIYAPYIEFGFWFFINLGIGYTHLINDNIDNPAKMHLFIGAPIPLDISRTLIVEPYYRPIILDERIHEFGILLKHGF